MSSQSLKFLFLSGLGLSLFLGNSTALAQIRGSSSGDVVVPTEPAGGTTTRTTIPTGTSRTRTTTPTGTSRPVDDIARFSCRFQNGQYTVMYQPVSQPNEYFAWATPRTLGGGWNTQNRCDAIAQRLETYRPDGLVELQTSVENRQNIICVTTEANPYCRIVLTVPPEKDPLVIRDSIFQNLVTADNGERTYGVNTYTSSGRGEEGIYNLGRTLLGGSKKPAASSIAPINLKPFLDPADRGTGTQLRNGVTLRQQSNSQNSNRLDPQKFR